MNEKKRLREVEDRIAKLRHSLDGILPIWNQVDRKIKSLNLEIKLLEDERQKLLQGQLIFRSEF